MEIKNVVVAGGGVLGSQIAFQSAYKGFNVTVWVRSEGSIDRAKPKFEVLKNTYLATLEAMKTNPAAYCRGLADDPKATSEQITNSSTMLPSAFAEHTGRPAKYLALHFANEIWRNNTAEVMGHPGTDQAAYDQVVEFAAAIGMVPLKLHKEQPGYILNSMLVPFLSAAEALYANEVADPETIDKTWMLGTGAPVGPFRILDIVGLATAYNIVIMNPLAKDPETTPGKIAAVLKKYIDEGKTGVAAGEGFYTYK